MSETKGTYMSDNNTTDDWTFRQAKAVYDALDNMIPLEICGHQDSVWLDKRYIGVIQKALIENQPPLKPFVKYEATEENIKRIPPWNNKRTVDVACIFENINTGVHGWDKGRYCWAYGWEFDEWCVWSEIVITHFMLIE